MAQLFTNNAVSTLAADITSVATSLTVATGHGARFPSPVSPDYFLVTLEKSNGTREIVAVTARSGDVLSGISRAQEGTTAVAFTAGDAVELRVTAETMADALAAPPQIYAGAMREIATVTTTGSQATVVFSGIEGTYRDLVVVCHTRGTKSATSADLRMRVNGDSGGSSYASVHENRFGAFGSVSQSYFLAGEIPAASAPASLAVFSRVTIPSYVGGSFFRALSSETFTRRGSGTGDTYWTHVSGHWGNAATVTQLEFFPDSNAFVDGSTFTLYGIGGEVGGAALNPIYTKYDPFCPPLNPSSLNDEFDVEGSGTGAPPGFTNVGSITPTYVIRRNKLVLTAPATAGVTSSGVEKTLPAGPFTVTAHVVQLGDTVYSIGGIYVRSSVSGKRFSVASFIAGEVGNTGITTAKYSSFTARDSFSDKFLYERNVFLRIMYDGTTLSAQFSVEGSEWTTVFTEAITTYFSGGNLPDRLGIDLRPENAGAEAKIALDFFRYFPAANADIGRSIGVGSDGTVVSTLPLLLHNQVI